MILDDILNHIDDIDESNIHLYFITRVLKSEFKKTSKVLDKFDFKVYQIDINDDIRTHLFDLTIQQLKYLISKKTEITDYDVISDDTDQIFTYPMANKVISFSDVVNKQLNEKAHIPRITNLEELISKEELWAYCVGFNHDKDQWIYTFRKILRGKVAVDEKDSNVKSAFQKEIRTWFSPKSNKLELIQGETINLDKQLDCIFYNEIFYIAQKQKFEQIIGLEEEYKTQALQIVEDLKATLMIDGTEIIKAQIESNPAIHKKLVRLSKLNGFDSLNEKSINKMKTVAKKFGEKLKIKDGKLQIEDEADIDLALKMLAEYYKEGMITGKAFGTWSGKELKSKD